MPFFHQSGNSKAINFRRARSLGSIKRPGSASGQSPKEEIIPSVPALNIDALRDGKEYLPEGAMFENGDRQQQQQQTQKQMEGKMERVTRPDIKHESRRANGGMQSPERVTSPPVTQSRSNNYRNNAAVATAITTQEAAPPPPPVSLKKGPLPPIPSKNRTDSTNTIESIDTVRDLRTSKEENCNERFQQENQKQRLVRPATPEDASVSDNSSSPRHDEHGEYPGRPSYDTTQSFNSLPSFVTDGTGDTSVPSSPAAEKGEAYIPLDEYNSYDLLPPSKNPESYSLEDKSLKLFSGDHLQVIMSSPTLLGKFVKFLGSHRPKSSMQLLVYYFDAMKALNAIKYANAIAEALEPINGLSFTDRENNLAMTQTSNALLKERANNAFTELAEQEMPRYITWIFTEVVTHNMIKKITGTLGPKLKEAAEGLAEVFCLTDPSRPDNPIIFASEEFNRATQYGIDYIVDRNCRFLQGPQTDKHSVKRLRDAIRSGREISEVFLNYRRDGSPFMNLLMVAPLCDSRGNVRYFIGAQCDVTQLVRDGIGLESFKRLEAREANGGDRLEIENMSLNRTETERDEFQDLCELFSPEEIESVRTNGGRMHKDREREDCQTGSRLPNQGFPPRQRIVIKPSSPQQETPEDTSLSPYVTATLRGVYRNYLLVRPYPSLKVLFSSPSLRTPGILQSPFLNKIGGSHRVRDELEMALTEGRGVTAKVRWLNRRDEENASNAGRERWIHCTPLLAANGAVGVWMVVVVDEEGSKRREVEGKQVRAPTPVSPRPQKTYRDASYMSNMSRGQEDRREQPREHRYARGGYDQSGYRNAYKDNSSLGSKEDLIL